MDNSWGKNGQFGFGVGAVMSQDNIIGVVGAGTMGSGIAQVAALAKKQAIAVDLSPEMLEKAKRSIGEAAERY